MENKTLTKYLFVCLANRNRSKTGERVFREMLTERVFSVGSLEMEVEKDFHVGSAGVAAERYGSEDSLQYDSMLGEDVDLIFAADRHILRELEEDFKTPSEKIVNLEIPDDYHIHIPDDLFALRNLLREKLVEYVPEGKK
jgi:protein-tyrosine-phosphatase